MCQTTSSSHLGMTAPLECGNPIRHLPPLAVTRHLPALAMTRHLLALAATRPLTALMMIRTVVFMAPTNSPTIIQCGKKT